MFTPGKARLALIKQPLINHVVLVIDNSASMSRHTEAVKAQVRQILTDLREQSTLMGQQIRVTIYQFATEVEVLVFDTDVNVIAADEIADLYSATGWSTALLDGTGTAMTDLASTSSLYGDHAFLTYVITDGGENDSRVYTPAAIQKKMSSLLDNWTVAMLVPNVAGRRYATDTMGVPFDNVAIWDTNSRTGFEQASKAVSTATANFLRGRASGQRSTRSVFSTGTDAVNTATVTAAADAGELVPVQNFTILQNGSERLEMRNFVGQHGMAYVNGQCFYEFFKTEHIQPQKQMIIRRKKDGECFTDSGFGSPAVRAILGLPQDFMVKVKPDANPDYEIFVQSTAPNRKVIPGKRALILR